MVYFKPHHEVEVLSMLRCKEFWNNLVVIQPTTKRITMFQQVPLNESGSVNKLDKKIIPMQQVLEYITKPKENYCLF